MSDGNLHFEQSNFRQWLAVDLDGTFLKTDLLYEGVAQLLFHSPHRLMIALFVLLFSGKLSFKLYIAEYSQISAESLPVRAEVFSLLSKYKQNGSLMVLISGSADKWVQQVAKHYFELFDFAIGSSKLNLKGAAKIKFLDEKFGVTKWIYIGNSSDDIPILEHAGGYYVGRSMPMKLRESLNVKIKLVRCSDYSFIDLSNFLKRSLN